MDRMAASGLGPAVGSESSFEQDGPHKLLSYCRLTRAGRSAKQSSHTALGVSPMTSVIIQGGTLRNSGGIYGTSYQL